MMSTDKIFADQRFLITGAAGFIGANLVHQLLSLGAEIHAVVRPTTNLWRLDQVLSKIKLYHVDMTDHNAITACVNETCPDYVVHLAVQGVNPLQRTPAQMITTNVLGTFNLLNALTAIPFQRLIHFGGSTEYGRKQAPMSEHDVLEPISFYGAVKAASTLLVSQFAHAHQKPIVIMRPFSVYGYWEASHRLIPTALRAALNHGELRLTQPGIRRDFIFIEDVVEACLQALQVPNLNGEIINVGTGHQASNEEVVETIQDIMGQTMIVSLGTYPAQPWDTSTWVADCHKARQLLRWEARYTLRTGLEKSLTWLRQNLNRYA